MRRSGSIGDEWENAIDGGEECDRGEAEFSLAQAQTEGAGYSDEQHSMWLHFMTSRGEILGEY